MPPMVLLAAPTAVVTVVLFPSPTAPFRPAAMVTLLPITNALSEAMLLSLPKE